MGVPPHLDGAGNSGNGGHLGIYIPPPEHVHVIHFDPFNHGLVFGGRAEYRNAPIQAMMEAARPVYHEDKDRAGSCGGGGGDRGGIIGGGGIGRVG